MIDDDFIVELWNCAREETDKIRDEPPSFEKIFEASEAIAARIVRHAQFYRIDGLKEIHSLPDDKEGSTIFMMGLIVGHLAAWRGLRFFDPEKPSQ